VLTAAQRRGPVGLLALPAFLVEEWREDSGDGSSSKGAMSGTLGDWELRRLVVFSHPNHELAVSG
jgi:hypothetical protein